jgi:hypothetical protein
MADQKSLRVIGLGFTVVTAAVALVAVLLVADAERSFPEAATAAIAAQR